MRPDAMPYNATRCSRVCTDQASRAFLPPVWSDGQHRLVIGLPAFLAQVPASDAFTESVEHLKRSVCSIRVHHPSAFIYVVASALNAHASMVRQLVDQHANASAFQCSRVARPAWDPMAALVTTASFALENGATHFAFMRQHNWLVQPLPLQNLLCPFMSFQVSLSPGSQKTKRRFDASADPEAANIERVSGLGFVARREVLQLLVWGAQNHTASCNAQNDTLVEQALAAVARNSLGSPPLSCVLDGCAPAARASLVKHADEVACHGRRIVRRLVSPLPSAKAGDFTWSPALRQCAALVSAPDAQDALTSDATLLPPTRFVGPPAAGIAHDVLIGLAAQPEPHDVLYGPDAMERLLAEPAASRRVLIVVHSFESTPFGVLHSRMLQLPRSRDLWIVRDAAILLLCNNAHLPTVSLVAQLRGYVQRARWLIHSPINPGTRGEKNPGYLCGETSSLVQAAPVWTRYDWVLYSNPDVVVTPELFASLAARLAKEERKEKPVDLIVDRFPGGYHKQVRYSMEFVVMRTAKLRTAAAPVGAGRPLKASVPLVAARASLAVAARTEAQPIEPANYVVSAFADILLRCVVERGHIPEYLLHVLELERGLKVGLLGAVEYLTFCRAYDSAVQRGVKKAGPKTFLYPGSIWHNHDEVAVEAYLRGQERNASAETPRLPTAAELKEYPYV